MKKQINIEGEVQKTMDILEDLQKVEGNPYLYTRLQAQMEKRQPSTGFQWGLAMKLAAVGLLLIVNIMILSNQGGGSLNDSEMAIEALAADYELSGNDNSNLYGF